MTQAAAAAKESLCINGRTFIGNTPTIRAKAGRRIRWYVFNLDLGMLWHNFHLHGQRFRVGDEMLDTRSIGPAESFIVDTVVPPVVLLPLKGDCADHAAHCCGKEGEMHLRDVPGLMPRNAGRGRAGGARRVGRRAPWRWWSRRDARTRVGRRAGHGFASDAPRHGADSHSSWIAARTTWIRFA